MARKTITARTGERLIRLADELEGLIDRMRGEGFDAEALGLRRAKDEVGAVGRQLLDKIEKQDAA